MHKNYYQILGIERGAESEEIKSAFRRLAFQYHPDHNDNALEQELFMKVKEAYEILGDPHKRIRYDEQLNAEELWDKKYQEKGYNPYEAPASGPGAYPGFDYNNYYPTHEDVDDTPKWITTAAKYLRYVSYITYVMVFITFLDAFLPRNQKSEVLLRITPDVTSYYLLTRENVYKISHLESLPSKGDTLHIYSTLILSQPDKIQYEDEIGRLEVKVANYYHVGFLILGLLTFLGIKIHIDNRDWVFIFCLGVFHIIILLIWLNSFL